MPIARVTELSATSDQGFEEAINIFGKKVGRRKATSAGKALLARHVSGSLRIVPSDETILDAAQ